MSSTSLDSSQTGRHAGLQENKIILIWGMTNLLVVMNTTMFNVAIPFVLQDFSLSSSTAAWLVSGYSIMFAISTLTFSRLSDFIPLSKLLLYALSILGMASVIGFFSTHYFVLLSSRIVQAAGAGAVMGLSMVLAGRYIPIERRGKAMAIFASVASLGFGLGPVLGGIITQYLGWHYLFAVTGLSVLSIPFFQKLLPKEEMGKGNFDLIGALLTGIAVTGLLLYLSTFQYSILIGTVIAFAVLWIYLNKKDAPFIPPIILRNKQYVKLLIIGSSAFFINFANLFLLPILLTTVLGKSPTETGLIIFPGAILSVIVGQYIGKVIDRHGSAPLLVFGHILFLASALMFALFATVSPYFILFIYMFASIGFTAITSSNSNEITRILPDSQIGTGVGILQLIQFFGGGIGVTISGLMLTNQANFSPDIMYRNTYLCFASLIFLAIIVYAFYYRNARGNKLVN